MKQAIDHFADGRHYFSLFYQKRLNKANKTAGTVTGGFPDADGRRWCMHLEGSAVEVGVRILEFELLDGPPGGGGKGDVVALAIQHPRVENTDHMTLAIEDERA